MQHDNECQPRLPPVKTVDDAAEGAGRDAGGRFVAGCAGGPGRPKRQTEREYLDALIGELTMDRWRAVVVKAIADAEVGDGKARDWLSRHVLPVVGREVVDVVDPDMPVQIIKYYRMEPRTDQLTEIDEADV